MGKIVAIAYRNFGHKVKNVAVKLAEQREGAGPSITRQGNKTIVGEYH